MKSVQPGSIDADRVCLATLVNHPIEIARVNRMLRSLRQYGGTLKDIKALVFRAHPGINLDLLSDLAGVEVLALDEPADIPRYFFRAKITACAQAENLVFTNCDSLIWINPECLVIRPPLGYVLANGFQAALRPVHHQNIGSMAGERMDPFWAGVYQAVGTDEFAFTVQAFVDKRVLRPYYNSHAFSIEPSLQIMNLWMEIFTDLVRNQAFQERVCQDIPHQVFLHQAILSTLLAKSLGEKNIHILPIDYNYPLNLHDEVPEELQPKFLNDLTTVVYEEDQDLQALPAREPLLSWLINWSS